MKIMCNQPGRYTSYDTWPGSIVCNRHLEVDALITHCEVITVKMILTALAASLLATQAMARSDALFDTPMNLLTNPSSTTRVQTPLPDKESPFFLEISSETLPNNKHPIAGGGPCYTFQGDVNVDTATRKISDLNLKFTRDFTCANTKDLTIEDYAFELLKSVNSYDLGKNKVQMKDKSARTILWFEPKAAARPAP